MPRSAASGERIIKRSPSDQGHCIAPAMRRGPDRFGRDYERRPEAVRRIESADHERGPSCIGDRDY
jgi:hypothetical protein